MLKKFIRIPEGEVCANRIEEQQCSLPAVVRVIMECGEPDGTVEVPWCLSCYAQWKEPHWPAPADLSTIPVGIAVGENPLMVVEFKHLLCQLHGEPFHVEWPKGYAQLIIGLHAILPGMFEQVGGDDVVERNRKILKELERKPVCCRLGKEALLEVYLKAEIGKIARCENCKEKRRGTKYRTSHRVFKHLCFHCLVLARVILPPTNFTKGNRFLGGL